MVTAIEAPTTLTFNPDKVIRAAEVIGAVAIVGDIVGRTLGLPLLQKVSRIGECIGGAGLYSNMMHHIED
jgi:hypothetical protein